MTRTKSNNQCCSLGRVSARIFFLLVVATIAGFIVWLSRNSDEGDDYNEYEYLSLVPLLLSPLLILAPVSSILVLMRAVAIILLKLDGTSVVTEGPSRLLNAHQNCCGDGWSCTLELLYEYRGKKYTTVHVFQGRPSHDFLQQVHQLRLYPGFPELCLHEEAVTTVHVIGWCIVCGYMARLSYEILPSIADGLALIENPFLQAVIVMIQGLLTWALMACIASKEWNRAVIVAKLLLCFSGTPRQDSQVPQRLCAVPTETTPIIAGSLNV